MIGWVVLSTFIGTILYHSSDIFSYSLIDSVETEKQIECVPQNPLNVLYTHHYHCLHERLRGLDFEDI